MKTIDKVSRSLIKDGFCEAGLCDRSATSTILLDILKYNSSTDEVRAISRPVKVCLKHKVEYIHLQEELLDEIYPERKQREKRSH